MNRSLWLPLVVLACGGTPSDSIQPQNPVSTLSQAARAAKSCPPLSGACTSMCGCPSMPVCASALHPVSTFAMSWTDCTAGDDQLLLGFAACITSCNPDCGDQWLSSVSGACQDALDGVQ